MTAAGNRITRAARSAHTQHWRDTSSVSMGNKRAIIVTTTWQKSVASDTVLTEQRIRNDLNERIDVIDLSTSTAYEMKVSSKNPQHEFYKDIFKVLIYNRHHDRRLGSLVFITGKQGANKLEGGLPRAAIELIAQCKLNIRLVAI